MDYAPFVGALMIAGLPTDDLGDGGRYYALDDDRQLNGFGGLKGSGADQMIRSVVSRAGCEGAITVERWPAA
jgi:hypothetical protein